jgi:ATP-binding cassette subfamily B protein
LDAFSAGLPYAKDLAKDAFQAFRDGFEECTFGFGAEVVREGEPADSLYLIISGTARALKRGPRGDELSLGRLQAGGLFGEIALLEGGARTATVRASGPLHVLRLGRDRFVALCERYPEIRGVLELQARHRAVQNLLREGSPLGNLPLGVLTDLVRGLEPRAVRAGEIVVAEGDPPGSMYVIQRGRFRVYTVRAGQVANLAFLREGDYFGELSLLRDAARAATVVASTEGDLLEFSAGAFADLCERHEAFRHALEERAAEYDYEAEARIPLDFHQEIMPAAAFAQTGATDSQVVGPHLAAQVEERLRAARRPESDETEWVAPPPSGEVAPPPPPPARPPTRLEAAAPAQTPPPAAATPGPSVPATGRVDDEPFVSPEGYFRYAGRKRVRRFPFVWQVDEMDCGVACLAMICRYHGKKVSFSRLRDLAHTSVDGTSLRSLSRAATELGLASRAVKASKKNLDRLPCPALAHWDGNHWVCLLDVTRDTGRVADPARGDYKMPRAEFEEKWSGYAALFDPTPSFEDTAEDALSVSWVLGFLKPYTGALLQSLLLALIGSGLTMLIPVFTQVVVDRVVVDGDARLLDAVLVALVATIGLLLASSYLQRYLIAHVALRVDRSALDWLTRTLLRLPLSYFQTRRTGDIERRLDGVYQIRSFVVSSGISALVSVTMIVAALSIMFAYSPILTGIYAVVAPIYVVMVRLFVGRVRPLFGKLEEEHGIYRSHRIDAIRGMESLKAAAAEPVFREKLLERFISLAGIQMRADLTVQGFQVGLQGVSMLTAALFLWGGAKLVLSGDLTLGGLVAFTSLVAMTNGPILSLLSLWDRLQVSSVLARRLTDVVEQEPEQGHDHSHLLPVPSLQGTVEVRGLELRYGGPEAPLVLDRVNFQVPAGATVAIVGRSGSGKTTIMRILAGLLNPTGGTVLYDGVDLKTISHRQLRRRIGVVSQSPYLFDGTILENIAFGLEPDLERAMDAARTANAHEFVTRLPLGYETKVGESGVLLSGGQKQRIAIARAIYRSPAVLLLDEATSALDTESERAIQEALEHAFGDTTVFIVAHRLSTVRNADRILVLERGKLVEEGTHEELMDLRGLYFYLTSQQLGGG